VRRILITTFAVAAALIIGVIALTRSDGGADRPPEARQATAAAPKQASSAGRSLAGLNLTAYTRDGYSQPQARAAIERIAALDANAITLTPTWYMENGGSGEIRPDPKKSPSDASLVQAITWIRGAGLQVILKPHVDVTDGTFRGDIQPADRQAWFRSYGRFIGHFAKLANDNGAELFAVGTELKSLSGDQGPWRSLIARVRSAFGGRLTYAANWDEYQQIQFWDALDLIGIDAYFPLAEGTADPGPSDLASAWSPIVGSLKAASEQWDRPILLTEVGYPSQAGATAHPWEVKPGEPPDPELQARATQAVFTAFEGASWLAGINWWSWRADPTSDENPETDYTPEGKPAEQVLRQAWGATSG